MASVCDSCESFKAFGKKCWFYWDEKQTCTQYRDTPEDAPHYRTIAPELLQIKL